MRSENAEDNFFRMSSDSNDNTTNNTTTGLPESHGLWLNLTSESGSFSQTYTGYIAGATTGVDNGIDSRFISDSETVLVSVMNEKEYIIQARGLPFNDQNTEALQLRAELPGSHTITLDHTSGLFEGEQTVYLKDNLLGLIHNIKESAYTFTTEAGTFPTRFEVVYTTSSLGTETPTIDANSIMVYKQDNTLHINSGTATMQNVKIFDIRGRLVYEQKDINSSETIANLKVEEQMLIVQITTTENIVVTKKVIY